MIVRTLSNLEYQLNRIVRSILLGISAFALLSCFASRGDARAISVCEQTIEYHLFPPVADVPPAIRPFSGVWVGEWDQQQCIVLIVEEIAKDGTAFIKYLWGRSLYRGMGTPDISQWSGKIDKGVLRLRDHTNAVKAEFQIINSDELEGTYWKGAQAYRGKFVRH